MRFGNPQYEVQAQAAALDLLRDRFTAAIKRVEQMLAVLGIDAQDELLNRA